MSYSLDFRKHVLKVRESEGLSIRETARRFAIGTTTLVRWLRKITPQGYRNRKPTKIDTDLLRSHVNEQPDMTHKERAVIFGVSPAGICVAMKRLQLTYKKNADTSQS